MDASLLEVRGLQMYFPLERSGGTFERGRAKEFVRAVDGANVTVEHGEPVGLVGESGCGKSTLGRCIVGLYRPTAGEISINGVPVKAGGRRSALAARSAQIIFQDPYSSLNPRMSVRQSVTEALRVHRMVPRNRLDGRCAELLDLVRLSPSVASAYPRQLSGGQRQRVCIARALAVEPELLVADEPVSALDVSVQATVLNLLSELRRELGLSVLLIAHNMAVVRHVSERTMVMYLGRIIESGPTHELFSDPRHPYTRALLLAVPRLVPGRHSLAPVLVGDPPSPIHLPVGCRFEPRCPIAEAICRETEPGLESGPADPQHAAACHFAWSAAMSAPTAPVEAPPQLGT
jgi:oligopeptide/dipeptide ABC transporter ATP-binding protein